MTHTKKLMTVLCSAALALCLFCSSALADKIKVDTLEEAQLYRLYNQIHAQLLLNDLEQKDSYTSDFVYRDFERNPTRHSGEKITFTGTVIQVLEGGDRQVVYRVAKDDDNDQVFYLNYALPEGASHILDGDKVAVYAVFRDVTTYLSTTNLSVTVPYCDADLVICTITNKNVLNASAEELNAASEAVDKRLASIVKKDSEGNRMVTQTSYEDYARNDAHHALESIAFNGKVVQVMENETFDSLRVAVDSDTSSIMYVLAPNDSDMIRVLEDDVVVIQGIYTGLYTYSSTFGGEITIPSCLASDISVQGYTVPASFPKDDEGNYKLTKKLFEDYARRPGAHVNENITFNAKVLQVIEGTLYTEYRMAVDGDSDDVIYTTIAKADRGTRILENDSVVVTAAFDGLISYTATSGAKITIPQCTAKRIDLAGASAMNRPSKNQDGQYVVHSTNYESFSRDESAYIGEPLAFTAKVVQVSEGRGYTIYRLAVDQDNNSMFIAQLNDEDRDARILEDDIVQVTGTSTGLYSYQSTFSGQITIPSCQIDRYSIDGYIPALVKKNSDGGYTVTVKNYETFARDPDPYAGSQLTFSAKVIQVVERTNGNNVYRVAINSDYDCIFYVEYDLPKNSSRILENDIVTLTGTYYGLYTYSTTIGSAVTVPALIATDIHK